MHRHLPLLLIARHRSENRQQQPEGSRDQRRRMLHAGPDIPGGAKHDENDSKSDGCGCQNRCSLFELPIILGHSRLRSASCFDLLCHMKLIPCLLLATAPLLAQVKITKQTDRISVDIDGKPFTELWVAG